MKRAATILWVLGISVVIGLVFYHGFSEIVAALSVAGWGLLLVCAYSFIPLYADSVGWAVLIPRKARSSFFLIFYARWICGAINSLLPVAQIGGDFVRARLIAQRGTPSSIAGASVVVDITVSVLTQIIFSLVGVYMLFRIKGLENNISCLVLGIFLFSGLIFGFYLAQRTGMFSTFIRLMERVVSMEQLGNLLGSAEALDEEIDKSYKRLKEFGIACSWRMMGWILGTGEVWLALYVLGHPISFIEAFMLESIGQAIRSSAFIIPGAYGVQEGGYIFLGSFVGLDPESGLALSLVKRVRELLIGLPALLIWQLVARKN